VEGSFDEAVSGVDGVFHTASPVLVPHDDNIQVRILFKHFHTINQSLIGIHSSC
jgi:hypothetical protein